ncbi:MAG: VOC family protein [Chthoniobacteraceae bacterium]
MITDLAFVATPVTDMRRAQTFYEGILGLKSTHEAVEGHWVEYEFPGGTFAITDMQPEWKPSSQGTVAAFEVDDIDDTVANLKLNGVELAMGIFDTPVCRMAIVEDPDGNKVTIHQHKK